MTVQGEHLAPQRHRSAVRFQMPDGIGCGEVIDRHIRELNGVVRAVFHGISSMQREVRMALIIRFIERGVIKIVAGRYALLRLSLAQWMARVRKPPRRYRDRARQHERPHAH